MLNLSAFQICDLSRARKPLTVVLCPIVVLYCCLYVRYISSTIRRHHMNEDGISAETVYARYPEYKNKVDYQNRLSEIFERFPWMERKRFTPNQLVQRSLKSTPEEQRNTTIVFVHNQKAGGSTIKACLKQIVAQEKTFSRCYGVFDGNGPGKIMNEIDTHHGHRKCYVGESTFGICDDFDNPTCSYFTMLRDPYERIISSFEYCKTAIDPLCAAGEASDMTLKEWALQQGSYFYRQLLFRPTEICTSTETQRQLLAQFNDPDGHNSTELSSLPCWYRHKVLLEGALSDLNKIDLLAYIIENLENWFGVVGITEDFPTSLKFFQLTYGLPFYDLCSKMIMMTTSYETENTDQLNNTKDSLIHKLKLELESDKQVRNALYYDVQIYKKIKEIFYKQKEFLPQSLEHRSSGS